MRSPRLPVLLALLAYCVAAKVLSHHAGADSSFGWFPWNFSPIYALGLFGAATYREKFWAYAAVPVAYFLGDALIAATDSLQAGFRPLPTPLNYAGMFSLVLCGAWLRGRTSWLRVGATGVIGGVFFYVITNFGSWWSDPSMPRPVGYSRDLAGLLHCYWLGVPFAYGTFASILVFAAALFSPWGVAALTMEPADEPMQDALIDDRRLIPAPVPARETA
jgi:hypothetical protein